MLTQKPWLKFYEMHVPEHLEYPQTVLPSVLEDTARERPDSTAILFKGRRLTYRELNEAVDRFSAALQQLGVNPGDRVAVHLPNCPQFVISYYAALRIGAIVVPCNPLYQLHEMKHQLCDSGAQVIITLSSLYPVVRSVRPETELRHVVVAKIKTYFPPALNLLFTLLLEKKKGHRVNINGDANTHRFMDLLAGEGRVPERVDVRPEDTAVLMYTGGTTGISKGAQLTHRNILANAYQCKIWLNAPDGEDLFLVQIPLFHAYGMTTAMNLPILTKNGMLLIPDPRDLKDIIRSIHKYRPSLYPGVPAMYNAINNFKELSKYDLSSIRVCISGAAGLPVEVQERFHEITGARLIEGYGLSEASPVTHANPLFGENRVGSIGLPWPDTEVKIVDVDTGRQILGIGEVGELCIRGPQVMKGYWNMPTETANALRYGLDGGDPWLHTGDIAIMDEDGYFRIVDRKKDMILGAGGYNIYPREIEDTLYEHPKVLEAAAVGIPMGDKGERIKVYVVLKPGEMATADEIIEFCRQNLAPYKVPKMVEFRDVLPKTMVGKILRRELLNEELEHEETVNVVLSKP